MAKCRICMKALIILMYIFILSMGVYAQELPSLNDESKVLEFSVKSEKAIIGRHPGLGVTFSSIMEKKDNIIVDIRLRNKKQLIAHINYEDETSQIQFISLDSGQLLRLTQNDLQTLHVLNSILTQHIQNLYMPRGVVDALLSALSLLYDYPPNEFLDLSKEEQKISPKVRISLCEDIGNEITGTYDIEESVPITESETVGPCASGDCFGRCGPGCGYPPDPLIQRFAQGCFDHDLCARATGEWFGPCYDEWRAAVDDFLFATNCNEIKGDWTVNMTGTTCFQGDCGDVDSVKLYHFQSIGTRFRGTSDPSPYDGRVSIYQGTLSNNNQISGYWRIPTYMGPECGNQSAGYAKGNFTGQNNCGEMTMSLDGVLPWHYIDTCTIAGNGSFQGNASAARDIQDLNLEDRVKKRTDVSDGIAPTSP